MTARRRRAKSVWLLTADPPVCTAGRAVDVLSQCAELRRGNECVCRFDVAELEAPLRACGGDEAAEMLSDRLEPEDVEDLLRLTQQCVRSGHGTEEARQDVSALVARLRRLVARGSGLTDAYSDEIGP